MTSTTFFKSKFKKGLSLFLWTIKTNRSVIVAYLSILAFYAITCAVIGGTGNNDYPSFLMLVETFLTSMIIGLIVSIKSFSYLHNKRQTDMTGSLPVSRRTLFFTKLFSATVISGVPMVVVFLLVTIFYPDNLNLPAFFDADKVNPLLVTLSSFVMLFSNICFFGLLSICCGKTSDKIVSFVVINFATPIAIYFLTILPAALLIGYNVEINPYLLLFLSPALSLFSLSYVYWLIFSAVCLILSFLLIKIRRAESADSGFAYKFPLIAIKVLVSFSAGIVSAFLFLSTSSSTTDYIVFWFGMIVGSLIAHVIIQIIFAHGLKGFVKGLIPYGAMLACFAVFFSMLHFGWYGFEEYVPKVSEIKSVSLTGDRSFYVDGVNIMDHEITDKKIIKDTVNAHKKVIELESYRERSMLDKARMNYLYKTSITVASALSPYEHSDFNITYTLNDGRKINRNYTNFLVDGDASTNIPFLKSYEYVSNTNPLFVCDEKYITSVELYHEGFDLSRTLKSDKCSELLHAIRKDYKEKGYSEDDESFYILQFYYGKANLLEEDSYELAYVDIPKNYSNTLKLIHKYE
ncbi:MAG: hypothetical protein J1E41_02840 [Ruminococcus sp.]|nr:hypothetical protein [Ruminococcus sp.]